MLRISNFALLYQDGPQLKEPRSEHSCGILYEGLEPRYIIVAGGWKPHPNTSEGQKKILTSVEYLDLKYLELNGGHYGVWVKSSAELPVPLMSATIINDPSTDSIFLAGGDRDDENVYKENKDVFRLYAYDATWQNISQFQHVRADHVAMFVPENLCTDAFDAQ